MYKNLASISAAITIITTTLPLSTYAQTQSDDSRIVLEEVIVTANRREENLQEVPMSVSAYTGEFFKDTGIKNLSDIDQYTPSLKITPGADSRSTSVRIRGIGSVGSNSGIDPSVGIFIDGVYQGRAGMSISDLIDIERVEVLRGPQGTLYGKNTAAGAISIFTRQPSNEFEAEAEVSYNNQNRAEVNGLVNIPFGNSGHAMRVTGFGNYGDHLYENTYEDGATQDFNDANKWGLKARTLFDFEEAGEFLLTVDYSKEDTDCCALAVIDYDGLSTLNSPLTENPSAEWAAQYGFTYSSFQNNEPQGVDQPEADPFGDKYWVSAETYNKVDVGGVALEWNYELPKDHTLTFINAWRTYESDSGYDGDFTAYDAVVGTTEVNLDQYSSELRIASVGGETIDYQAGLYAYYSEFDSEGTFTMLPDLLEKIGLIGFFPNGSLNTDDNTYTTTSFAAFGQATWNINDQWSTTLGLRWTREIKERDGSQITEGSIIGDCSPIDIPPVAGPCLYFNDQKDDSDISPTLNVRYFATDDLMTYASVSRGFKSGGFDQRRVPEGESGEFEPEIATNYELGWKSTWFERRLQVNGTFYFVTYDDFQSQTFDGSSIKVTNAGNMESYGMELDMMLAVSQNLIMGSAIGYNKAEYKDFDNGQCTIEFAARQYYEAGGTQASGFANPPCVKDLAGETVDNTPEWTVSSYLQYTRPITDNLVTVSRLEYNFTDTYYLDQDLDPNLENDASNIINARFTLTNAEGDWEAALWGKNLLNEETYVFGIDIPTVGGYAGVPSAERTYGVTLRYLWN